MRFSETMSEKKGSPKLICVVCNEEIDIEGFDDEFATRNDSKSEYVHVKCQDKMPNQGTRQNPGDLEG